MRYEFLPPYSPDLNPIERLRRDGDDFCEVDCDKDEDEIISLLHEKVMSVSSEHAEKWFRWSGYHT